MRTPMRSFLQQLTPSSLDTCTVLDNLPNRAEADEDRTMILAFDNKYRSLTRLDGRTAQTQVPHRIRKCMYMSEPLDMATPHPAFRYIPTGASVAAVLFGQ